MTTVWVSVEKFVRKMPGIRMRMEFPGYTIINLRYKNTWKIEEVRNITAYFNIWKGEFSLNLLLGVPS